MNIALALAAAALAVCALDVANVLAQSADDTKMSPAMDEETGVVTWQDVGGEATYRVSGQISYLPDPSCASQPSIPAENPSFSEDLQANSTSYQLPTPSDPRLTFRKDVRFTVEALDSTDTVIAQGGLVLQADPVCTAEEIAAAGGGPGDNTTAWWLPATIAALGAAAVATGVALRKAA